MKSFIYKFYILIPLFILNSCDPNKELYETMDNEKTGYFKSFDYTLIDADYTRFGGTISQNLSFSDALPAMNYIPRILKVRFVTMRQNSRALVTYNHLLQQPDWLTSGFGYELTDADYAAIGAGTSFSKDNTAQNFLPIFLFKKFPSATKGTKINLIYKYNDGGTLRNDLDIYEFDGNEWGFLSTTEKIPYVGYELQDADYSHWDSSLKLSKRFSDAFPADTYLPILLRSLKPLALPNDVQVVKYKILSGTQTINRIDKYIFDGTNWIKSPYKIAKTEQYVFGSQGWAFDPTVMFRISRAEYLYMAQNDPIPHESFNDTGYYYGAAAFYSNFDFRLLARRLNKTPEGNYRDPQLGAIYENQGAEAAMTEMYRRITEEAIIKLLQYKFPEATPQVGGIDVHYFVTFETFADNWIRKYPETEYICTSAGSPPQFKLVNLVIDPAK
jgi:hypothetical protein